MTGPDLSHLFYKCNNNFLLTHPFPKALPSLHSSGDIFTINELPPRVFNIRGLMLIAPSIFNSYTFSSY